MTDRDDVQSVKPADLLRDRWKSSNSVDLDQFLNQLGSLSTQELADVIRVDQSERWRRGMSISVEDYLRRYPQLSESGDREAILDLIFNEYLLAESLGQFPHAESFVRRFPDHAETLALQIDLHKAVDREHVSTKSKHSPITPSAKSSKTTTELPELFGRYRILRKLGQGGMGTVYLAHDNELDRNVALKVPSFPPEEAGMISRFVREARIAAGFHHPHLCPVFDVGTIDGRHYLTMPVISGESLAKLIKEKGRFSPPDAIRMVLTIAKALSVAHQAGIIHRDLKPANIMLDENHQPVVMDFGLARRTINEEGLTTTGVFIGTPAYAPPEQITSEEELSTATDVYSLGAILFELLTGRIPFAGPASELIRRKLVENPQPPSRFVPALSPAIDRVCLKALARSSSDRFATMNEFATALEKCLTAKPERKLHRGVIAALAVSPLAIIILVLLLKSSPDSKVVTVPEQNQTKEIPVEQSELLSAGSIWLGKHSFDPKQEATWEQAGLTINQCDGSRFRGIASIYEGDFQWEIEGTVKNDQINWKYVKVIREKEPSNTVQNGAYAEGRIDSKTIEVTFLDPVEKRRAEIRLTKSNLHERARSHVDKAWKFNEAGKRKEAITECDEALKLDDRYVPALVCRAYMQIELRNFSVALLDINRALEIDPNNYVAYADRAWIENESEEYDKAFTDAAKAISLDAKNSEGYYQRGWSQLGRKRYKEAISDLTEAIRLKDRYAWAFQMRGKAKRALGKKDEAAKDFAQAKEFDPNIPNPD